MVSKGGDRVAWGGGGHQAGELRARRGQAALGFLVNVRRQGPLLGDGQVGAQMVQAGGADYGARQARVAEREAQHELEAGHFPPKVPPPGRLPPPRAFPPPPPPRPPPPRPSLPPGPPRPPPPPPP